VKETFERILTVKCSNAKGGQGTSRAAKLMMHCLGTFQQLLSNTKLKKNLRAKEKKLDAKQMLNGHHFFE